MDGRLMAEATVRLTRKIVDRFAFTIMEVDKKNLDAFRYRTDNEGSGHLVSCPELTGLLDEHQLNELVTGAIHAFDSHLKGFHGMIPYEVLRDDSGVIGVFFERWQLQ
jgi:hypothetical protein